MQQALRLVSQELGADAVILSSKKVPEGFEVVAALDYQNDQPQPRQSREVERQLQLQQELEQARDFSRNVRGPEQSAAAAYRQQQENSMMQARASDLREQLMEPRRESSREPVRESRPQPVRESLVAPVGRSRAARREETERQLRELQQQRERQQRERQRHPLLDPDLEAARKALTDWDLEPVGRDGRDGRDSGRASMMDDDGVSRLIEKLNNELSELKNWMVSHGGNAWDTGRPLTWKQSQLWQRCQDVGLEPAWSDRIVAQTNADLDPDDSWKLALRQMAQDLPIARAGSLDKGGVFALLGPTGAGKTTTIGKLAARAVIQHGPESVALVTIDNYRVAAHDQLRSVARILGVELHTVPAGEDLGGVLTRLGNKKTVLVDTAGLASQDSSFREQLAMLKEVGNRNTKNGRMRCLLTLPLTSQGRCLQENYEHFKPAGLAGCIFTKLDECFSLGPAMSIAALTRLPIVLITDGPHIPDDLHYPEAGKLVKLAEQMARMARTRWQAAEAMGLAPRPAGSQHGVQ